jgi:GH25 family lysozyme M1 (1,4-beta-N-acetylmuramidase)
MQNGRLTGRQLAPIFHPTLTLFLADGEAAASWNTMRLHLLERFGRRGDIRPEGPLGAYRDFAGQLLCKTQFGKNAATPGRSNHGWGRAVDLATNEMADLVDRYGGVFGWHHWDAKWEWWHREYDGGFGRPDPGPDEKNPVLRRGSGGPGQLPAVKRLQRALNAHTGAGLVVDGDFGDATHKALAGFQRGLGSTANGVVSPVVWAALGSVPVAKAARPKRRPAVAANGGLLRGFDVSDARGDVDFVKAQHGGMAFAAVRVADGDIRDVRYGPGRIKALRDSGLSWFPYYFARVAGPHNGERDGAAEAAMAVGFARSGGWGRKGDLPLAYDFENPNGQPAKKCARHLIQFVDAYRSDRGHYPIVYTMPGFWGSIVRELGSGDRRLVGRCPLWIASWGVPAPPSMDPWSACLLWQDSDHGTVAGVTSKCDTDRFFGTTEDFGRLLVS